MFEIEKIKFKCSVGISMEYDIENDIINVKKNEVGISIPFNDLRDVVEFIKETPLVED